ncbi:low affinity immunoglobulin gamma Fc region receptor II-like [Solea senegalensis]|uniref:high affinity immunoglobulin gamma Fc receptor I-like n=1 Tax=Solea senegalensis TaxID=28829 RepID=UPI001C411845|nr:high affinity immunoglobulin gamma Fc receptor I-like [Solea senegalensis]KAG7498004.1 low affinity immunoglobulin gamma Fc region receptor II-like [Solea senegalensis]
MFPLEAAAAAAAAAAAVTSAVTAAAVTARTMSSLLKLLVLLSSLCRRSEQAAVTLSPDSSQVFDGQSFSLSCEDNSDSAGWTVRRNTSTDTRARCEDWGIHGASTCGISNALAIDTGVYWCESGEGGANSSINITVTNRSVILLSPALPVAEGRDVTLRCKTKTSSNREATFYRNGFNVSTEQTGHMTIHNIAKSDEGVYKCRIVGEGESETSWITVSPPTTRPPPFFIIPASISVGGLVLLVLLVLLVRPCVRRKPVECDAAPLRSRRADVRHETHRMTVRERVADDVEDVSYGQIIIRANLRTEHRPEPEIVYSSLKINH